MKRLFAIFMAVMMVWTLCACGDTTREEANKTQEETNRTEAPTQTQETKVTEPTANQPAETTTPMANQPTETTAPPVQEQTKPTHSEYYLADLDTDTFLRYFSEVVLDAEFINSGSADVVQKWNSDIAYALSGAPTAEDEAAVAAMVGFLNDIPGFPGMYRVENADAANLQIHFVSAEEMINILGSNFHGCDGGVTIWWDGNQQIYKGTICVRTDLDQYTRNSVIKEEIYNGMGPVQDTNLRSDSLIYSGFSTPQDMTRVDRLIMTLLYHKNIHCGMTAAQCESVLRELYY